MTIPKGEVPRERLDTLLDWLRFEASAQRSQLTEEEAGRISEEMKADWWAANKDRFAGERL